MSDMLQLLLLGLALFSVGVLIAAVAIVAYRRVSRAR
jgi:hypothetical protein